MYVVNILSLDLLFLGLLTDCRKKWHTWGHRLLHLLDLEFDLNLLIKLVERSLKTIQNIMSNCILEVFLLLIMPISNGFCIVDFLSYV